jgi:ribosomal protection tetracycline resistance protein
VTTINIGIVAHVDAGKTSLTERILYETHVIREIGRVDNGTTQTDSLELEKRRGITIKASVVSFFIDTLKVNLIDTPGHPDFLAEVERSLSVLDGAILLISAVEGTQAQTKILHRALQRLRIPTIIFVNKIDRGGAESDELIKRVRQKLTQHVVPLYQVEHIGSKDASITPNDLRDTIFRQACIEQLAHNDERFLAAYAGEEIITTEQIQRALMLQAREARLSPLFFGSALTGAGVKELLADLGNFIPSSTSLGDAPLSGLVFKLEKEATGEKVAYVRVLAGTLSVKTPVTLTRRAISGEIERYTGKTQKLQLFCRGKTVQVARIEAGEFGKVCGLRDAKIGDVMGAWSERIRTLHFATPRLETRIEAVHPEQDQQLYHALMDLAEQDPLIFVLKDDVQQTITLRIFGEVQKEVIETTLKDQYGLEVRFAETGIVCMEKPGGTGEALEVLGVADNPFLATVGLRVEPGLPGSGVTYMSPSGALPLPFYRAIEETVRATLAQGVYGWEVTDIMVTLTHTGRIPTTTAGDFRYLVPLVLMAALSQAGTAVYEPINRFELSAPAGALSTAIAKLSRLRGVCDQPVLLHGDTFLLTGTLPMKASEEFKRELPSFTEGEGDFLTEEAGFRQIEGKYPTRLRTDHNPLHRKEYLSHVHHVW